ncbi:MAG TPA: hypothetical protein GXZ90_05720 [Clostridiales bacterium]|nr:hypothetical protein [Clostridiales bacterium]
MSILNDLKYAVNTPAIKSKFENVKKKFYLENNESQNVIKDFKRYFPEYKTKEASINEDAKLLLEKIYFTREEDGALYLKVKQELIISILLYIPRGINMEIQNVQLNKDSKIELSNIFNIYGTEGFSVRIMTDNTNLVIEPTSSAGIKGLTQVSVYSLEDNIVIKDDASNYIDCQAILEDYRG